MLVFSDITFVLGSDSEHRTPDHTQFIAHNNFFKESAGSDELDAWSSFQEETLTNEEHSDLGIEKEHNRYKLNVVEIDNLNELRQIASSQDPISMSSSSNISEMKRQDSFVCHLNSAEILSLASGKEVALQYLKRNDTSSGITRINSMVTNTNSLEDFKKELLNSLRVPIHFQRKETKKPRIRRSSTLPKRVQNERSINDGKLLEVVLNLEFKTYKSL